MTKYRFRLPQLDGGLFLTDGGIETCLIFHDKLELPYFAAFHLMKDATGRAALHKYYSRYAEIARNGSFGFIRASSDWGNKLGYSEAALTATAAGRLLSEPRMTASLGVCTRTTAISFDRASSRPLEKLEIDQASRFSLVIPF